MRRVVTLFANYYLQTGLLLLYYYVNERIFVDEKSSYIICKLGYCCYTIMQTNTYTARLFRVIIFIAC
jgi:hypothetical protein